MPTDSTCFHVAIIGPSDTNPEVRQAKVAVSRLSDALSRQGITLAAHHWSQLPPGIGDPQGYIDESISWGDIDFVIGFIREKWGTPVADSSSGTKHEVSIILDHHSKTGSPELLFYFHSQAIKRSDEIAKFAEELRRKALTGSYNRTGELESMISDHLRSKIEKIAKPPSGVPLIVGRLPHNRRLTVEWLMGAQFPPTDESIATIVVFKNGRGEEYLFDTRQHGAAQLFCNWVFNSMGFGSKPRDTLNNYLIQTTLSNIGNKKEEGEPVAAQLWLGNMIFFSQNKMGRSVFKLLLAEILWTNEKVEEISKLISSGRVPLPEKKIYLNEKDEKVYQF